MDIGADLNKETMQASKTLLSALLKLINKIYHDAIERANSMLKDSTTNSDKTDSPQNIYNKIETVNYKKIQVTEEQLSVVRVKMTAEDFKKFSSRCEKNGITMNCLTDSRHQDDVNKSFFVYCKQSSITTIKETTLLMNSEKEMRKINDEINNLRNGDNPLNKELIKSLEKHKESIRQEVNERFYNQQANEIFQNVENEKQTENAIDFNNAIDRLTGSEIDTDKTCYIVDAKKPENYLSVTTKNQEINGSEYTEATYEAYNGKNHVYTAANSYQTDKEKAPWADEKKRLQEKSNIGNTVFKFYSMSEVEQYRKHCYEQSKSSVTHQLENDTQSKNYDAIVHELNNRLETLGFSYNNETVYNKNNDKAALTEEMSLESRANTAEAILIGKQIALYSELGKIEEEKILNQMELATLTKGTPEYESALAKHDISAKLYNEAKNSEQQLMDCHNEVNALRACEQVQMEKMSVQKTEPAVSHTENTKAPEGKTMTMDMYRQEISQSQPISSENTGTTNKSISKAVTEKESR